ncbi:MAG: non-specific protein-tyrosine kinase [Lachnoclostridium sp.]|jgi:capsular exopolysaccharide synthesis family protein
MQSIKFERIEPLNFISNEAFNTLKTNIQFCGKNIKSICMTSCMSNEGKTEVSFRLAASLADSGKKVLFVDADLRKSVLIGRYRIDRAVLGLSQYLSGMNQLDEVLYQTNIDNLDIIFTGPIPPNPSELLGSQYFHEMIETLKPSYDYIIVDTPPLGIVIDSANVAKFCDGTILVVETHSIRYKLAQKVVKQLEKGNCRILGAVINKVNVKQDKHYGKYYGGYYGDSYTTYQ